ncbi:MAG: helix-turn-helix domain-containing protein [Halorientalis sp.]
MSQSTMASVAQGVENASGYVTEVDSESDKHDILDALNDDACRGILDATDEEALSANELSEACDLPLSTTYRKLDLLTSVGLLEEDLRVRASGTHAKEYSRLVEDVVVSVTPSGDLTLKLCQRDRPERVSVPAY